MLYISSVNNLLMMRLKTVMQMKVIKIEYDKKGKPIIYKKGNRLFSEESIFFFNLTSF